MSAKPPWRHTEQASVASQEGDIVRVLVTGGTGVLERAFRPLAETAGHDVRAPGRAELDLFDPVAVALAAIYRHALATGFSRGFEVAAGILLLALIVTIAAIRYGVATWTARTHRRPRDHNAGHRGTRLAGRCRE
jgi:hypothetical protein